MKCVKVIVPRLLIDSYLPHPEFSGELLVVLENGLFTDVYTDKDLNLVTCTSDRKLIRYLRKNRGLEPKSSNLNCGSWNLRRIEFSDQDKILEWFNRKSDYSVNDEGYTRDTIIEYISHSLTKNSRIFIIEDESIKVGIVAYDAIYGEAIIHLDIYEKTLIEQEEVKEILKKIMDYVKENYNVEIFVSTFFTEDFYSKKLFEESGFSFEEVSDLEFNHEEYKKQLIYRYDTFRNIITEADLKILDEFLELANDDLFEKSNYEELKSLIIENLLPRIGMILENNYFNLNDSKEEKEVFHNKVEKLLTLINERVFENNISEAATLKEFKNVLYQTLRIIDKNSIIKEKLIKRI
jgi:hypothetical protein